MTPVNLRAYDTRDINAPFTHDGEGRTIPIPFSTPGKPVIVNLTAISLNGKSGFFAVSNDGHMPPTAALQLNPAGTSDNLCYTATNPAGAIDVYLGGSPAPSAHLIIDVQAV